MNFKNLMNKKKKGNATAGVLIGIFVLLLVTLLIITEIQPLIVYFEIRQAGRTALLKMETQGGMTQQIRDEVSSSISFSDYDSSLLTITPGINVTPTTLPLYGSTLFVDIDYKRNHTTYSLNGFSIVTGTAVQNIGIHYSTTSKKAQ